MKKTVLLLTLTLCLLTPAAQAELRLAKIFTDNMVLQRELPAVIWGWADKGAKITLTFAGQSQTATAGDDGKWTVKLTPLKASAEGRALTVQSSIDNQKSTIKNVLVGEVWLCAGQSNMNRSTEVKDSDETIRLFWIDGSVVPMKDDLGEGVAGWVRATPKDVASAAKPTRGRDAGKPRKSFAEVGYVFGKKIQADLKVPVGLIKCAFGGSNVSAWTPQPNVAELYPYGKAAEGSYLGHRKGLLYQSMIHGIVPMAMRGVVWYQGENDGRSKTYHTDMVTWIASWRKAWARPDMPFYYVQIAPTTYAGGRMQYIWEAQAWVMHNVPHTGLGVTNDMAPLKPGRDGKPALKPDKLTGFPLFGGGNPHPSGKHIVGERLANIALVKTYGRPDRVLYGPMLDSHTIKGDTVRVKFKYAGSGLAARDDKALNWFEVSDGTLEKRKLKYVKAQAKIAGLDTIEVRSPDVKAPKFVRFAWNCEARHNLMNKEGLPAVSFKTDDPIE